jgi:hypothetical protein
MRSPVWRDQAKREFITDQDCWAAAGQAVVARAKVFKREKLCPKMQKRLTAKGSNRE